MDVVCHGIGLALGVLTRVRSFGLMLIRVRPPYASGIRGGPDELAWLGASIVCTAWLARFCGNCICGVV